MNLSDAITAFLADRRARGLSRESLRNEKQCLELLLADVGNIQVHRLRPQHLDTFWANRTTWSAGTMNRGRAHLSTFFKWCRARGHMPRDLDPMEGTKKIRVTPRDRAIIPQGEFQTLLSSIEDPRRRIAVAIGLYLFLRLSEISNLRWQDINLETSTVQVYRSKTRTMDDLPICDELRKELLRWKRIYAIGLQQQPQPGWYVVPGVPSGVPRYGVKGTKGFIKESTGEIRWQPTTKASLNYAIRTALKDLGYYRPMEGGHTLRRSGAIALYNELSRVGHDRAIRICQAMLGHSSVQTTEIYLRLDLDRKVRNDLLAGKRMFGTEGEADVIDFQRGTRHGEANAGAV